MSVQRRGTNAWRVRWEEGETWHSRTFALKRDADTFDAEIKRRRKLGQLASTVDAGIETLNTYVTNTWAPTYGVSLATVTRTTYSTLYDKHVARTLGSVPLRELTPELIGRWQSDRLNAGAGPVAVRQALGLVGNMLQRAAESGRIPTNPVRLVRKAPLPRKTEVRPLAPITVEAMRAASSPRDAMLISILAYAGPRPGEALGLRWHDVGERTMLVERAISIGEEKDTKTRKHRAVRLLSPLAADLREWRLRCGRPDDRALIIPGHDGKPWTLEAYGSWRKQAFARAVRAAGLEHARPYDLRHSFASLLLHEGRSVVSVAKQLGHSPALTLSTYAHVIDELDDAPREDAEASILAARSSAAPQLPIFAS